MEKSLTITFDNASSMGGSNELQDMLEQSAVGMGLDRPTITIDGNQVTISLSGGDADAIDQFSELGWYMDDVTKIERTEGGQTIDIPCPG